MVECNTMFLTFTVEYVANKELNDLLLSNIVANILRALLGPIERRKLVSQRVSHFPSSHPSF
jgi:hypothetical protein